MIQQTYPAPMRTAVNRPRRSNSITWIILGAAGIFGLFVMVVLALGLGLLVVFSSGRILPGVTSLGITLGGQTPQDAAAALQGAQITLRDGIRTWQVNPAQFGLTVDANGTSQVLQNTGRKDGALFSALVGSVKVSPLIQVNQDTLKKALEGFAATVNLPPANATIRLVNGDVKAVPAVVGRSLDVNATFQRIAGAAPAELADGVIDLVMTSTSPAITDSSVLLNQARTLLASPLNINAYDPIADEKITWSVPVAQWGQWLTTSGSTSGIAFSIDRSPLMAFLHGQNITKNRYLDFDASASAVQAAIVAGHTEAMVRLFNSPTKYQVQPGDTLGVLAWKFGIPFWQIDRANPTMDLDVLSAGQTITIPSKDVMLPLPIVYNKRIVVSISRQHMTVYENGQVKWDWVASTGIPDSPTMPGVFQVQSHVLNAYAGNWNLYMPNFMGIYDAVPGFTNGIHGFPTRNGVGLLWTGDLGHKVTFGCILVSSENAQLLYNWAQEGVVVEIQP